MPLQSSDRFVVQRGNRIYQVSSSTLKQAYGSYAQVYIGSDPPSNPTNGDLWWSTLEGNLFIWYDELASGISGGNSAQWVDASPAFVEIDYQQINDYIDQSVLDNAVSQIIAGQDITLDPENGKATVEISFDRTWIEEDQARQDQKISDLEQLVLDLAAKVDDLQGGERIDGGYPNAIGLYTEEDTDGGEANPDVFDDTADGGSALGYD